VHVIPNDAPKPEDCDNTGTSGTGTSSTGTSNTGTSSTGTNAETDSTAQEEVDFAIPVVSNLLAEFY
jgi:hypothetical protein